VTKARKSIATYKLRTGQAIGTTDKIGAYAVSRRVQYQDVLATIYHNLGIDVNRTTIEDLGGAAAAIERGFQKAEIENAAYRVAREIDDGDRIVVGVNKFATTGEEPFQPLRTDPAIEAEQAAKLARLKEQRDNTAFGRAIAGLKKAAGSTDNVLYPLRDALRADATLGEVCDALREIWGEYQPGEL